MTDPKQPAAARAQAAAHLLDRGWGKPKQELEHTGTDGGPIMIVTGVLRADDADDCA